MKKLCVLGFIFFFLFSCLEKKSKLKICWISTNIVYQRENNLDTINFLTSVFFIYNVQIINDGDDTCIFKPKNLFENYNGRKLSLKSNLSKNNIKIPPQSEFIIEFRSKEKLQIVYNYKSLRKNLMNPSQSIIKNTNLSYHFNKSIQKIEKSNSHFLW